MKTFINLFSILGILFLASCEEVIEVDIPEGTQKLVVEGYVTTEQDSSFVKITKTLPYFDNTNPIPKVTTATVVVNADTFYHTSNGIYRPKFPYVGVTGRNYHLKINAEGKFYESSSMLDPLEQIDTITSEFKPKEGFMEEGYAIAFWGLDNRPRIKYTYFSFGFKGLESLWRDSMNDFRVLYDNKTTVVNERYKFELPVLRLAENDTAILIFRSIDEPVYKFFTALNNAGGGGPFSTPPANLPSNIRGTDVMGVFSAQDIKRFRYRVMK